MTSQMRPGRAVADRGDITPYGAIISLAAGVAVLVALLVAPPLGSGSRGERVLDESAFPKLPAPEEAPAADLPGFRQAHPRLPAPTQADYDQLLEANPSLLKFHRNQAKGGTGSLDSAILMGRLEPGSQDLGVLRRRLLALTPDGRGAEQTKPLALAYDWLFDQWSPDDRRALLQKTLDACDYETGVIRNERLSPYNVILYNSPFQALMACAIATYRDDPRSAPVMNFTADLWLNRVLPVWRQIMGKNGGWHEGGEYVGIGIGQAIHEVPAMWRKATGQDLFASEPGIRSFADFLVYRTRPDGTHFRWGDGAFFDRIVSDALPLALELRHAAAYSLRGRAASAAPTGWPWGPLADPALYDPTAVTRLPLTRYFDGVGMVVARSDWSAEATYVTFKAGDNYWSHTHLDQGAFTIYKGGELAIDSGFYGPKYGSDHHMNYTYQTVAHNTVTVTDPEDNVPAPDKDKPRPIANDGGQRRIGSGWGVEPAPLDRAEWDAKRDIYHTATMEKVFDEDDLTVAVADITPAYTNDQSGRGTFSDRTRRVERFWRTFGYDRADDVIVVFDRVTATHASFRKRWLLHTIEAPQIAANGFTVDVMPQNRPGHAGGRLEARVLLPRNASINAIGGRGFEFFVDDKNYDENGTLQNVIRKLGPNNGEPGAWRVEVSPAEDAADSRFLVVLLPTLANERATHRVRLLEAGERVGCEIVGPRRTTRWWFDPGHNGVEIEVVADGETHRYPINGQSASTPAAPDWRSRMRKWLRLSP